MPATRDRFPDPLRVGTQGSARANTVVLAGRVTGAPTLRKLPSGDPLVTFRISVPRALEAASPRRSDWFDCSVWGGRVLRSCQGWQVGDLVEVHGELRRRHYQGAGGPQQRVEVAVVSGRRVRRGARG